MVNCFLTDRTAMPVVILVSVRLLGFNHGGSKLIRFLVKIEDKPRKVLYFVNKQNTRSSKYAKIGLSKATFDLPR